MKLEKLTLANFRGFDQIDLDFAYLERATAAGVRRSAMPLASFRGRSEPVVKGCLVFAPPPLPREFF